MRSHKVPKVNCVVCWIRIGVFLKAISLHLPQSIEKSLPITIVVCPAIIPRERLIDIMPCSGKYSARLLNTPLYSQIGQRTINLDIVNPLTCDLDFNLWIQLFSKFR